MQHLLSWKHWDIAMDGPNLKRAVPGSVFHFVDFDGLPMLNGTLSFFQPGGSRCELARFSDETEESLRESLTALGFVETERTCMSRERIEKAFDALRQFAPKPDWTV